MSYVLFIYEAGSQSDILQTFGVGDTIIFI